MDPDGCETTEYCAHITTRTYTHTHERAPLVRTHTHIGTAHTLDKFRPIGVGVGVVDAAGAADLDLCGVCVCAARRVCACARMRVCARASERVGGYVCTCVAQA